MLTLLLILPLLTAAAVALRPQRQAGGIALTGSLVTLFVTILAWRRFDFERAAEFQLAVVWEWVPALGLRFALAVDSVSLILMALTALLMPLAILGSFSGITHRQREFYAWILILEAAMLGVFMARDLLVFYTCFEFTLVPMFFLIAVYGSANRAQAAIVFFLYTFTGSLIALIGFIFVGWFHWETTGSWTFDIGELTRAAAGMSPTQQAWLLLAFSCGFAVKVPLFPVHTWLPLAHTEAPTAGSVILAAILLKLGSYGLYRFALPMAPLAVVEYAPLIAILCLVGITYGALICWVQRDMKRLIAYSSVAHMGFCILGLVALNHIGIAGSVFYMVNHGLSTGALFLCVGMIYERYHTRSLDEVGGLARRMPIWTAFTVFFVMTSVGLPGLNGFIGEFLALVGTFISGQTVGGEVVPGTLGPWYAVIAGTGIIFAAMYLLYFTGMLAFGPLRYPHGHHHEEGRATVRLPRDLSLREIVVLAPIAFFCILLGVKPVVLLDRIEQPVSALVEMVQARGGQSEWTQWTAPVHIVHPVHPVREGGP